MNKLFLRDDDISFLEPFFPWLLKVLVDNKIPMHFAVIPTGPIGARVETHSLLKEVVKAYPELFEVGLHGYTHIGLEFVDPTQDLSIVKQRILEGEKILRDLYQENFVKIFTPPGFKLAKEFLPLIEELGYSVSSSVSKEVQSKKSYSITFNIEAYKDPNHKELGERFATGEELMSRYKTYIALDRACLKLNDTDRALGILMHHAHYKDLKNFEANIPNFVNFIRLAREENIELVKLSKLYD